MKSVVQNCGIDASFAWLRYSLFRHLSLHAINVTGIWIATTVKKMEIVDYYDSKQCMAVLQENSTGGAYQDLCSMKLRMVRLVCPSFLF